MAKKEEKEIVKESKMKGGIGTAGSDKDTSKLSSDKEIAYDFAVKAYEKFNKLIKSIILFGSSAKQTATEKSDIDLIVLLDDCAIQWDEELVAWYREELGKVIKENPYKKSLHINTVRLSTWWADLLRGDPVVINVIRYGEALVDFGGFFNPLKVLLQQGKIKSTPEAIYTALQRAPAHMARSKAAMLGAMEGLYWAMVDSAHAALISARQIPPSPEHITEMLKEQFVDTKMLSQKYIEWYKDMYVLAHKILHGNVNNISGREIDVWAARTDDFIGEMAKLVKKFII
ncbi:MAG: nucleotidyltransferase domain-containing protein [archaeon]